MAAPYDFLVAFLGFSEFERSALSSYFRLAGQRVPHYGQVQNLAEADFLVADSDHPPSVQVAIATGRVEHTVFVGSQAPAGARAWLNRPIDAMNVMRELDSMVQTTTDFALPAAAEVPLPPAPAAAPALPHKAHREPAPTPDWDAPFLEALGDEPEPTVPGILAIGPELRPAAPPPPAPAPARKRKARLPRAADAPLPMALLVDDSPLALRFLETRLQPWGVKVDCAANSAQALELLETRSYGLAFLDVELGEGSELDGLALCRHIKQSPAAVGLAVIMISAHHSELDRVRGSLAGCDGYLAKPLNEDDLARLLLRHGVPEPAEPAGDAT